MRDAGTLVPLIVAAGLLIVIATIGSLASMALRWKRARAQEREQLKWFAYAAISFVVTQTISAAFQGTWLPGLIGPVLIPVGIGIAILRHRLYDIDRVINRTIVYVLVTGMLVAAYAGTVFLTSTVALGSGDDLTVALGTLIAAGLFRPVLRRTQGLVDRRFDRRKYNARQTIETFGARLRGEVDLDELTDDLVGVVRSTMQPAHVSVWLRGTEAEG